MKPPVTPTVLIDISEEQMPITASHPYWVYVVDDVETKIEIRIRIRDVSIVLSKEQAQKLKEDLIKCG